MINPNPPQLFLSRAQVEQRFGFAKGGLNAARLPPPDAIIGPLDKDGTPSLGARCGWLPETVDYWYRTRPGQGYRSDVRKPPGLSQRWPR